VQVQSGRNQQAVLRNADWLLFQVRMPIARGRAGVLSNSIAYLEFMLGATERHVVATALPEFFRITFANGTLHVRPARGLECGLDSLDGN
jgi:hypothetical protein